MGEVGMSREGYYINGADFSEIDKIPKIPRNPGGTEREEQCVPGSFFSAHAREPVNKLLYINPDESGR